MNTRTMKSAWRKVVAITVTVAIIATLPMAANAETLIATNTLDGVTSIPASNLKWQIRLDLDAKTAQLGLNQDGAPGGSWEENTALALEKLATTITIPRYFIKDGVDYAVTKIYDRAFLSNSNKDGSPNLANVTVLENITQIDRRVFHYTDLENILLKGPLTVAPGENQGSVLIGFGKSGSNGDANTWWPFSNTKKLKLVVVGPHCTTGGSRSRFGFPQSPSVTVLLPDRPGATSWRNSAIDTSKDNVVFYGPEYDFDMTMGETAMTFYPKNENGLTNILAWASTIKGAFDMDTKIAITNRIEMSEGVEITEAMIQNVTLEAPPWYLTFAVKSQEQLNNVLGAVSVDTPIIIDIEGAGKNQITVPDGRKVAILAKSGWTFGRKTRGLIISFH